MTPFEISRAHPSASLTEARRELTDLLRNFDVQQMQPASRDTIIKALAGMAEAFQVDLPEAIGLEIYVAALHDLPRPALMAAVQSLVRSHKWPRLPFPAEFIEAAQPELEALRGSRTRINGAIERVGHALALNAA
jgi:hypothetical protein